MTPPCQKEEGQKAIRVLFDLFFTSSLLPTLFCVFLRETTPQRDQGIPSHPQLKPEGSLSLSRRGAEMAVENSSGHPPTGKNERYNVGGNQLEKQQSKYCSL